jgi:hypothetical protein
MSEVHIYANGIFSCSVCAPKDMAREEVERKVNLANPAGTQRGWLVSDDKAFASGESNPCTCDQDEGRQHWLLDC